VAVFGRPRLGARNGNASCSSPRPPHLSFTNKLIRSIGKREYPKWTPTLGRVQQVSETVIDGILKGSLDKGDANLLLKAASNLTQATSVEVKVRINAPRIHAQEAK
jgi:hypothetical protein